MRKILSIKNVHTYKKVRLRPLSVLMIPYWGDHNPYLTLLASALKRVGVQVSLLRSNGRGYPLRNWVKLNGMPDVVHLHWQHLLFMDRKQDFGHAVLRTIRFFYELLMLRRMGIRFVWTVHNLTNHDGRFKMWERFGSRILGKLVDCITVHSKSGVSLVAQAFGIKAEKIKVVPHGNYADWYPPSPSRSKARKLLGFPADVRIFLCFGLIRPYKGVYRLIDEFRLLKGQAFRLVVVGEPRTPEVGAEVTRRAALDTRVSTHLKFVDDSVLVGYLAACDAVVLPYDEPLTSGAAILAATLGRPLIVPARGCLKDLSKDAAIHFDPDEPGGLLDALTRASMSNLDKMGDAARRYTKRFPWSLSAGRLQEIYRSLAAVRLRKNKNHF